jgi:hypothetical protein
MPLKYIFTVLYKDGSVFVQNEHDKSLIDPKRSCFTDAIHQIKDGKFVLDEAGQLVSRMNDIHRFLLQGSPPEGDYAYMVDLVTGHFEVNCVPFRIHNSEVEYSNRRLVFFRRHYQDIHVTGDKHTVGNDRVVYHLGWQANTAEGKNVQHVMEID